MRDEPWTIHAWNARQQWVLKDKAWDERVALMMFMGRATQMPEAPLRLLDEAGMIVAERNVRPEPRRLQ